MITVTEIHRDYSTVIETRFREGLLSAWARCQCCDDFWCNIHQMHAHDCECPPIDEWDRDPYSSAGPGDLLSSVVICT